MDTFTSRSHRILLISALTSGGLAAQIQLSVTISPSSLQINQSNRVLISLTNASPTYDTLVRRGDVLRLYLNLGDAAVLSLDPAAVLGGRAFRNGDWAVDNSAAAGPVSLVYQGADQVWPALESVSVSMQ